MSGKRRWVWGFACLWWAVAGVGAEEALTASAFDGTVSLAPGLTLSLYADAEQVQNPTALTVDDAGRVLVAETHRWRKQIHDNRYIPVYNFDTAHGEWLVDDLRCRTVEDRYDMLKRWADGGRMQGIANFAHFAEDAELVRALTDDNGDGRADASVVFADGFNEPTAGTAGGIFAWGQDVYFASIPSVWRMRDADRDGRADAEPEVLQRGFGVRTSISGHDLNGFVIGPDRRIYWSVGDRGYNFTTREGRRYEGVGKGAVFRAELDGANVERVSDGLRNPKELAFDDYGNLFTVDNNADLGDRARVYQLIEGADYGWRMGHQVNAGQSAWVFGAGTVTPSPWMEEGLWELPFEGQPVWVTPPLAYLTSGPCGFVANPGSVALSDAYSGDFFVVDYRGAPAQSGLFAFGLTPQGAGFTMTNARQVLRGIALTDVDFGYDGRMYLSDYGGGWGLNDTGRILTMHEAGQLKNWRLWRLRRLGREDFRELKGRDLEKLLGHVDRRVRLRAQFALVDQAGGRAHLAHAVEGSRDPLARLHGLWGLGILARGGDAAALAHVGACVGHADVQMRAQAMTILGECGGSDADVLKGLTDAAAPVRYRAALAAARLARPVFAPQLLAVLAADWQDLALRQACLYGLSQCAPAEQLAELACEEETIVRLAAVAALRKLRSPQLSRFVADESAAVRREAAAAIYDADVAEALPALAATLPTTSWGYDATLANYRGQPIEADERAQRLSRQLHRRVIYANWRVGTLETARRLLDYASNPAMPEQQRLEALHCLATWGEPHPLDRVVGDLRPLPKRDAATVYRQLEAPFMTLIQQARGSVLASALALAPDLGYRVPAAKLRQVAMDPEMASEARANALDSWIATGPANVVETLTILLADSDDWVFLQALEALMTRQPERAAEVVRLVTYSPFASEHRRQQALLRLEAMPARQRTPIVLEAMSRLRDWALPGLLQLEATEIGQATAGDSSEVQAQLAGWKQIADLHPLGEFVVARHGGDYQAGRKLFFEHAGVQCARCHALYGQGGNAGPDLGGVGERLTPDQIVTAIVNPGAEVAAGWGVVTINTRDGESLTGFLLTEDGDALSLKIGDEVRVIPQVEIRGRTNPVSAMPPVAAFLSKSEIRDLVAFLKSQTAPLNSEAKGH